MNSYSKNKNDNSLRIENSSKDYESVQKDNETTIDPVISTNKDFINENTQDTNLIEKNEIDATSRVHHNATKVEKWPTPELNTLTHPVKNSKETEEIINNRQTETPEVNQQHQKILGTSPITQEQRSQPQRNLSKVRHKIGSSIYKKHTNSGRVSSTNASSISNLKNRRAKGKMRKEGSFNQISNSKRALSPALAGSIQEERHTAVSPFWSTSHDPALVRVGGIDSSCGLSDNVMEGGSLTRNALKKLYVAYGHKNYSNAKQVAKKIRQTH